MATSQHDGKEEEDVTLFDEYKGEWRYRNPVRVVYGVDSIMELGLAVPGNSALLITTRGTTLRGVTEKVRQLLKGRIGWVEDGVKSHPAVCQVKAFVDSLRNEKFDSIIALGGGSVIDTAKVLSLLLHERNRVFRLHQLVETDAEIQERPTIPLFAIPTTAGSGSEMTPFATLWDWSKKRKYSIEGNNLFARVAFVDPSIATTVPKELAIVSGLDALSHGFEALWNRNCNPLIESVGIGAIQLIQDGLLKLSNESVTFEAMRRLVQGSMLAGYCISCTRTALAHAISYPLTVYYGIAHGIACSFTLPEIWNFNGEKQKENMNRLAVRLGFTSRNEVRDNLIKIMKACRVNEWFAGQIQWESLPAELIKAMLSPGRIENSAVLPTSSEIADIVYESLRRTTK